jgi:hypothetical protein
MRGFKRRMWYLSSGIAMAETTSEYLTSVQRRKSQSALNLFEPLNQWSSVENLNACPPDLNGPTLLEFV